MITIPTSSASTWSMWYVCVYDAGITHTHTHTHTYAHTHAHTHTHKHTHTHTLKQAHSTEGQFLVCKVCACAARESGGCDGDVADFAAIRLTLLCRRLAPTVDTRP